MKTILFIGRFQPFHLGHLSVLEDICKRGDVGEIIIGIGSSQESNTKDNPYSLPTREKMIRIAIKEKIYKPSRIIGIPDIHNDAKWVSHVENIIGHFDEIYTGNALVKKLFKKKGYKVNPVEFKINISGTALRKMIYDKSNKWKAYIYRGITNLIINE